MSMFHKIWIEVDVLKDMNKKTEMMMEIVTSLQKVDCVQNVTKVSYQIPEDAD